MQIGTTLKTLRTGKKISRQDLVKGIMSSNHYFKVENNENNISLDKFIQIISRLNISFEEFLFVSNNYKNNTKSAISSSIIDNFYSSNDKTDELKKLQKRCNQLFKETNDIFYKHQSILISSMVNSFQLDSTDIDTLTQYFIKIENYGLYEIKIFANFAYLFESDILIVLSKRILAGFLKFEKFEETNRDYIFSY